MLYQGIELAIDITDTFFNTRETAFMLYNQIYHSQLDYTKCTSYDIATVYDADIAKKLNILMNTYTLYHCVQINKMLLQALESLYSMGISLYFIEPSHLSSPVIKVYHEIIHKWLRPLMVTYTWIKPKQKKNVSLLFTANPQYPVYFSYNTLIVNQIPWLADFKSFNPVIYTKNNSFVNLVFNNLVTQI